MSQQLSQLPPIEAAYVDEHGLVDPDVYHLAQQLWPQARRLAAELLNDDHFGMELMLKAVARVSAVKGAGVEIVNPKYYLLRAYKNLLLAELEKEKGRDRLLAANSDATVQDLYIDEERINRRILISEIKAQMDDWTLHVFEYLALGYSFEELVPTFGSASNVIRSKYHKKMNRLASLFQRRVKDAE